MPYFYHLPDSVSLFRAVSLWPIARFKSFTKIPKTFCRLDLRRRGCWGQRENSRLLKAGSKLDSWSKEVRPGWREALKHQDILPRVKNMQLVSCSTASELNPFQKAARYSSVYTLAWEAKEGGLAPKTAGPQLARVHHGINTPFYWVFISSATLSATRHPVPGFKSQLCSSLAVCPLESCSTSLSPSSLHFKMGPSDNQQGPTVQHSDICYSVIT